MKPITAVAPLFALLLAACGSDAGPDAAATGGLTNAECTLLADRHRDMALASMPPGQDDTIKTFIDAAREPMIEECEAGNLFDRQAWECASAAAEGSDESHACIVAAHERG